MPTFQDLTGETFNRLTVIGLDPEVGVGQATRWVCRCVCGAVKSVRAGNLKSGEVQSCGCLQKDVATITDMIGKRYGRLVAVRRAGSTDGQIALWEFECDCGAVVTLPGTRVRTGGAKSCGCQRVDSAKARATHGRAKTPAYNRWVAMKQRCLNPNATGYANYGGRGITIHEPWVESFDAYLADVGECPGKGYSLDRIDNNGNYEPGNVKWSTRSEQQRNKRPLPPMLQRSIRHLQERGYTITPPSDVD